MFVRRSSYKYAASTKLKSLPYIEIGFSEILQNKKVVIFTTFLFCILPSIYGSDGVFSAKYSWLSALSTARDGFERAKFLAAVCPYAQSSVPATTLK